MKYKKNIILGIFLFVLILFYLIIFVNTKIGMITTLVYPL